MEANIECETLISIPLAELYEIINNQKKFVTKSEFIILYVKSVNMYMVTIGDFKYALKKQIPIMTNNNQNEKNQRIYIFPYIKKFMAVKLPIIKETELIDIIDVILSDQAHLICNATKEDLDDIQKEDLKQIDMRQSVILRYQEESFEETVSQQQRVESIKSSQPTQLNIQDDEKLSQKIANVLNRGGDLIREKLIEGASMLAPYIQKGADYLKSKIKKNEIETEVKQTYSVGAKVANTTTKAAVVYTKAQIEGLVQVAKTIGNDVIKEAEASETGQKIVQHKNYDDAKRIGKATLHAGIGIYDGLYSALAIIGTSLGGATCDLLEHKYGQQVGNVAKEGVEIVGNVGSLGRNVVIKTGEELSKDSQLQKKQ